MGINYARSASRLSTDKAGSKNERIKPACAAALEGRYGMTTFCEQTQILVTKYNVFISNSRYLTQIIH